LLPESRTDYLVFDNREVSEKSNNNSKMSRVIARLVRSR